MKIKEGFLLREILGEHIVTGEGLAQINFNKIISLNDSASWLWEQVKGKEFTEKDLVDLLLSRYDVTAERAAADIHTLVSSLRDGGVVE